jgi:hypothetical protein
MVIIYISSIVLQFWGIINSRTEMFFRNVIKITPALCRSLFYIKIVIVYSDVSELYVRIYVGSVYWLIICPFYINFNEVIFSFVFMLPSVKETLNIFLLSSSSIFSLFIYSITQSFIVISINSTVIIRFVLFVYLYTTYIFYLLHHILNN